MKECEAPESNRMVAKLDSTGNIRESRQARSGLLQPSCGALFQVAGSGELGDGAVHPDGSAGFASELVLSWGSCWPGVHAVHRRNRGRCCWAPVPYGSAAAVAAAGWWGAAAAVADTPDVAAAAQGAAAAGTGVWGLATDSCLSADTAAAAVLQNGSLGPVDTGCSAGERWMGSPS